MRTYMIWALVTFVILVGIWDRAQSLELFLVSCILLGAALFSTHYRSQRATESSPHQMG